MRIIWIRSVFFSRQQLGFSKAYQEEASHFYMMLLKMKKKHTDLNINRIMVRLYPDFKLG